MSQISRLYDDCTIDTTIQYDSIAVLWSCHIVRVCIWNEHIDLF